MRQRSSTSNWARAAAVVVAVGFLAVGCGTGDSSGSSSTGGTVVANLSREKDAGAPKDGGALSVGLGAETNSWNPYQGQWSSPSYTVANSIFDPLAAVDAQGKVQGYLAESFTSNADFTVWTIKLRPGVSFHNNEPFDAAAVKTNLEYGRKSGLTAQAFAPITSVDVVDPLTLTVAVNKPWSTFPSSLSSQPGYMAAPAMLADPNGGAKPIGTGPFVFQEWIRDNKLKVRKNPNYWQKGLPHLDSIEFAVLIDAQSRSQALASQSANLIETTQPQQLLDLQAQAKDGTIQMVTNVGTDTDETIIALNTQREPFNDPIARKAIQLGLNQDELSATSYNNAYPAAYGPLAQGSPFYLSPADAGYPTYNLDKAKELVAQYEQAHGKPLTFTALVPPDPSYASIAQALQGQAQAAGIVVDLQTVEQAKLITTVLTGDYQASGFVLYSTPDMDRAYPFIATKPQPGLSLNFTRNDNPRITAAMDAARATNDQAEQAKQYAIVQREMVTDADKIFLVHAVGGIAFANTVHGVQATTFPGSTTPALAGNGIVTPFLTATWVS
jgi:4-phytase/acid phosphatase/peptide/nickel transport system substrate-binding protein